MTDLVPTEPYRPLKRPDNAIRRRLRAALELMVWDGMDWLEAAKKVQYHPSAMRKALNRPHVRDYIRREKQVLRETLSSSNIHRLRQIRDAADNMPAVNAIKVLEQLDDEQTNTKQTTSPGITINIVSPQHTSDMAVHAIDQPGNKHRLADVPSADSTEHALVKAMSDQTILDPSTDEGGG